MKCTTDLFQTPKWEHVFYWSSLVYALVCVDVCVCAPRCECVPTYGQESREIRGISRELTSMLCNFGEFHDLNNIKFIAYELECTLE